MPKLKVNSNELQGTDVNFVSLVKRGANRIPFRIVKEDTEEMLDLNSIGRKFFQKADPTPGVFAVMVNKDAKNLDAIKEQLKASGLNVEKAEEKDGILFFKQEGQAEFDTGVVKLSDDVGLVVSGLQKEFRGWDFEATSFGEVYAVSSFFPSMRTGADAFGDAVYNIMQKADSPKEAAEMISKAADEFKTYLAALAKGLPDHAFKMDVAVAKARKEDVSTSPTFGNDTKTPAQTILGAKDNNIDGDPTHGNETGHDGKNGGKKPDGTIEGSTSNNIEGSPTFQKEDEAIAAAKAVLEKAEKDKAEAVEKAAAAAKEKKPDGQSQSMGDADLKAKAKKEEEEAAEAAAKKTETGGNDELLKSFGALLDSKLGEVKTSFEGSVEALKSEVASIKVSAEKALETAKKADEAISGTVHVDTPEDRGQSVRKTDRYRSAPPLLDTAYEAA